MQKTYLEKTTPGGNTSVSVNPPSSKVGPMDSGRYHSLLNSTKDQKANLNNYLLDNLISHMEVFMTGCEDTILSSEEKTALQLEIDAKVAEMIAQRIKVIQQQKLQTTRESHNWTTVQSRKHKRNSPTDDIKRARQRFLTEFEVNLQTDTNY